MKVTLSDVATNKLVDLQKTIFPEFSVTHIANIAVAAYYKAHFNKLPAKEEYKHANKPIKV
jgi:hypothetical protein